MNQKIIIKICALIMGVSGLVILGSTLYPILSYEWESNQKYPALLSPLVDEERAKFTFDATDYTQASNWFVADEDLVVKSKMGEYISSNVSYFTLSVPRLKIDNATVKIGGEDLAQSLIQFKGTALPGKMGNTVIFGHSVLPQYFDPENYLSIFSTLPKLNQGDLVYASYDGITYKYKVEDMFEVKPTDVQILEQNASDSFLTLVTCTPPGHPLKPKRLIIRARLLPTKQANANISYSTGLE
jgi:sortase A